jgi:hypothetical protein
MRSWSRIGAIAAALSALAGCAVDVNSLPEDDDDVVDPGIEEEGKRKPKSLRYRFYSYREMAPGSLPWIQPCPDADKLTPLAAKELTQRSFDGKVCGGKDVFRQDECRKLTLHPRFENKIVCWGRKDVCTGCLSHKSQRMWLWEIYR